MRVLCYSWAGVRSTDLESTVRFFAETLGLSLIEQHEGLAGSVRLMPSGQLFEVFGSKSRCYQLHACPVLGFHTTVTLTPASFSATRNGRLLKKDVLPHATAFHP